MLCGWTEAKSMKLLLFIPLRRNCGVRNLFSINCHGFHQIVRQRREKETIKVSDFLVRFPGRFDSCTWLISHSDRLNDWIMWPMPNAYDSYHDSFLHASWGIVDVMLCVFESLAHHYCYHFSSPTIFLHSLSWHTALAIKFGHSYKFNWFFPASMCFQYLLHRQRPSQIHIQSHAPPPPLSLCWWWFCSIGIAHFECERVGSETEN